MLKKISWKKLFIKILKILGIAAVIAIIVVAIVLAVVNSKSEIPKEPETGVWYRIDPEGARNADGSEWHGLIRKGTENKVVVYFFGGGISTDEYTAAHPEVFYHENILTDGREYLGIGSELPANPFRDWTFLVIPYTTGDLHIGTGDYRYTDTEGNEAVLHHHGYLNYRAFMDEAADYAGDPEAVLISGYSAGGFAAALLADDVLDRYFPDTESSVAYIDSAVLWSGNWKEIAEDIWQIPKGREEIFRTEDLITDAVWSLRKKHPETKILFDCSVRDGTLSAYQNYLDTGVFEATEEAGDAFYENLNRTCAELLKVPDTGIFIWDGIPYLDGSLSAFTQHTIMELAAFYGLEFDGKKISDWVMDAVNGTVNSFGTELLSIEESD